MVVVVLLVVVVVVVVVVVLSDQLRVAVVGLQLDARQSRLSAGAVGWLQETVVVDEDNSTSEICWLVEVFALRPQKP